MIQNASWRRAESVQCPRAQEINNMKFYLSVTGSSNRTNTLPSTSSSLDALTPRRAAVTLLQRQLSNADQMRKAEELKMRDVISATAISRSRTPSATSPGGITGHRLSPLRNASPNKSSRREIKFSPETKGHDGGRTGRRKSNESTPTITRECSIPVTMLGLDLDDNVQDTRSRRNPQGPTGQVLGKKNHFYRSFSSESAGEPGDEFYLRGHSSSRTSLSTTNYDWDDATLASNSSPPGSVRTLSASSERRLATIEERSNASGPAHVILDLDQMRLLNSSLSPVLGDGALGTHPYSRHLLPPTPVYMQNGDPGYGTELRDMEYYDYSGSSKENSPRTDEEMDTNLLQPVDNRAYRSEVVLAVNDVNDLVRPKSVLHQGQFNIASTRVGHSDDSGYKEDTTSGSNRSSATSSDGTTQAEAHTESQQGKNKKVSPNNSPSKTWKNTDDPREKLKVAAKENAAKKLYNAQSSIEGQQKRGNDSKNHVTVYSSQLQGNVNVEPQSNVSPVRSNTSVPGAPAKRPKCESTPNQPDAPAPTPYTNSNDTPTRQNYYIPRQASRTGQSSPHLNNTQKAVLKIKLAPSTSKEQTVAHSKTSQGQTAVPPERPPAPGSAGKERAEVQGSNKKSALQKSLEGSLTTNQSPKHAPPRPVAPPRSRTPSASSVSSSSSAGSNKEAPARPPPPGRPTPSPTPSIKPTAVKSGVNNKKGSSPTVATPSPKKVVTQTTSFRLSTYLAQKEAMGSYNMANDKIQNQLSSSNNNTTGAVTNDGPAAVPQAQPVTTGPSIILTSQSQNQFDLTTIPDINTVQPGDLDAKEDVTITAPQVKQIQVKEASPIEAPSPDDLRKSSDTVSKSLASISEVKLAEKPIQDEHNGPVIWDPFATIHAQQKQTEPERVPAPRMSKSATKRKAQERQPSAVQRNSVWKSKEVKGNTATKKGVRPKSPRSKSPRAQSSKKTKKTKKKDKKGDKNKVEVLMPDHPELNNVAYIGGLGWQIRTDCNEDDTIQPAYSNARPSLSYDTDEDEPTPRLTVLPNYLDDPTSFSELTDRPEDTESNRYLQLPGQLMDMDSDTGDETEDDIFDFLPEAEDTVDEVIFDLTPRIVDGVLIDAPKNKVLSPTKTPLNGEGTEADDYEGKAPEDDIESDRNLPNGNKELAGDQDQTELENAELGYDSGEEDQLSLSAFDKKGVMHWNRQRTSRNLEKSATQNPKKSPKGNPPKSTPLSQKHSAKSTSSVTTPKSAKPVTKTAVSPRSARKSAAPTKPGQKSAVTPKQPPKSTPSATPKQTPGATPKSAPVVTPKTSPGNTPKQTPGTTPKQTPGSTPKQTPVNTPKQTPKTTPAASPKKVVKSVNQQGVSAPQPPPRKSKMNKNEVVKEVETRPIPPKRNKTQQNVINKKEAGKEVAKTVEVSGKEENEEKSLKADATDEIVDASDDEPTEHELERQKAPLPVSEVPEKLIEDTQKATSDDTQDAQKESGIKRTVSKDEDTEIDAMIDEILKSTPHPSLSLSLKSQKSDNDNRPQRTQEELLQMSIDARNKLQSGLSKSQNGKLFCEVPVQKNVHPEEGSELNKITEDPPVGPLTVEEKKEFEKFVNSLRKMELSISLGHDENHNSRGENKNSSSKNKPPLPPKPSRTSESRSSGAERSPRFVRKLDSWKDGDGKRVIPVPVEDSNEEPLELLPDLSIAGSDFHSDAMSVASNFSEQDEGLVPKDGRVVTSRIGRHSSRGCSSAMSANDSFVSEDVETIQWKRGNMLGKGAYGKVWCGLTNGGELIAVKQIELNINDMEQAEVEYEKIQEEVELLKTLKHPNIVGYLGTSLEDNIVSIFMQFIPGGSIANLLARFGALEEEVFCHYTRQILEGVVYLHQNNVIHRDIKGGNVMLMHNGIIKLIDFGCAKRLCLNINSLNNSNNRLLKSMRGTPYWMAPEVVRETGYGTKSDIWSIGCTVYEMATRKPPWADVPPMAAIFAIGSERDCPGLPDKFSLEARDFVSKCMTRDQNLRPSATDLLRHPFVRRKKKR